MPIKMEGTYNVNVRFDTRYRLRVFAKSEEGAYFPMIGEITLLPATRTWSFDKVNIGATGNMELLVCLVDEDNRDLFDERFADRNYTGILELPTGIKPIKGVTINVQR